MRLKAFELTPFHIEFSFDKLKEELKKFIAKENGNPYRKAYYEDLLDRANQQLVIDAACLDHALEDIHENLIVELFDVIFPSALSDNEIKAVSMPFQNIMFNHTRRFKQIIEDAGGKYTGEIRNFNQNEYYIACCCIIMNYYFKSNFDLTQPLFIDLPDKRGITRYYRVLYNADFVELTPRENAVMLSQTDIELLQDNYDDFELWQRYFPQKSWNLKGFGLLSLVDVTFENALSLLKESFLKTELQRKPLGDFVNQLFSSIFKLPNLKIGLTVLQGDKTAQSELKNVMIVNSYLLNEEESQIVISAQAYRRLMVQKQYFSISDVEAETHKGEHREMCLNLVQKGVRSCLFSPIITSTGIEGILEIVSSNPRDLHSVNAQKLNELMPIISETMERVRTDALNHIEAIIQREYTTIHPSVYWKFLEEAQKNYIDSVTDKNYILTPIAFPDVFPLYGEIDIKGSSQLRNDAIQKDLKAQLDQLIHLLDDYAKEIENILLEKHRLKLKAYNKQVKNHFYSGLEQRIQTYIREEIHPLLQKESYLFNTEQLNTYFGFIDYELDVYYRYRKVFDKQIGRINKCYSDILDKRQKEAQAVYPHYYERFKTDGVEHNIYIGDSICPDRAFDITYLQNLRLWQLQVIAEQMCIHYRNNIQDEIPMDATSLILVYDTSLSIQFRMDEKRFDIDGSYNTRYEIIKKRLDKAVIQNSEERIVQPKSIAIVFASHVDRDEYMAYIKYLQYVGVLQSTIQAFEVEDLQGVAGLIGLRVLVNLNYNLEALDYQQLMVNFLRNQYL
ncbi:hypothetical protein HX004_04275 [Myroides sp. 1354]|uniref:hypothetical protein n=1 Tax=unclassified Myroides TaxID=2642485 RepID=UPI002577978C|nr:MULTISPECIES: hypothetical protein [unclassified Myroides]MDM1044060.1 hypothetical protein [Myroides sp. R163-1]MDM1054995.1 hypothetical protein [Myroides sp. 1354]MDM1068292.1 hypothetical protein [Myroides sp. 1372]